MNYTFVNVSFLHFLLTLYVQIKMGLWKLVRVHIFVKCSYLKTHLTIYYFSTVGFSPVMYNENKHNVRLHVKLSPRLHIMKFINYSVY